MKTHMFKKFLGFLALPLALLTLQPVMAQPVMMPDLLLIEESHMETPNGEAANAYFTITNLHEDPIRLLSASGEGFETASLRDANNEVIEYVEILPGERVVMQPSGIHVQLENVDSELADGYPVEFTLLVRQGREALPYQEGGINAGTRREIREGIPNEHEVSVNVPVRAY
tara:strand:+ start:1635 stop:2147 length:513 start_codon:yes stop_codon:yes gene_type:complete